MHKIDKALQVNGSAIASGRYGQKVTVYKSNGRYWIRDEQMTYFGMNHVDYKTVEETDEALRLVYLDSQYRIQSER